MRRPGAHRRDIGAGRVRRKHRHRVGDFAWRHLWELASNNFPKATASEARDEICLLETCSTSPAGISAHADGNCRILSARASLTGGPGYGEEPSCVRDEAYGIP